MNRLRDGMGGMLAVTVFLLAVPTLAIVATMRFHEDDVANSRALAIYRAALMRCDEEPGAALASCQREARAARLRATIEGAPVNGDGPRSVVLADAIARAQCDVLTGRANDACGRRDDGVRSDRPQEPLARALVADRGPVAPGPRSVPQPAR